MRKPIILSLTFVLCQLPLVMADRKADFQEAYQHYQQAIGSGDIPAALKSAESAYKLGSKLYEV